ncbi:MAG: nitroreductase family protein, partial [Blastocatellia bacterium]|nr:nitroreductase family protein [Blastocatellia bacterium]
MESIDPKFIPLEFEGVEPEEQFDRGRRFFELIARRRTVREYSNRDVPFELIERAIATAGTAPSGANLQPWRFVVVRDAEVKRKIREAAEAEEYESYHNRMSDKWLRRLAPLGTDEHKPFLEIAPYLLVVFRITTIVEDGESEPTYYSQESVGIAVGLLLAALHNMGLATLTHTPSPMKFLQEILERPKNEVPFVLI